MVDEEVLMPAPNSEDARIYLQLLEISQQPRLAEAIDWMVADFDASSHKEMNQRFPPGSAERSRISSVLGFYEAAGVVVSRGLLHEDVFFDAPFRFEVIWPRVEALIADWQKTAKDPAVYENLVWLARRYESWHESSWRPKSEAIPTDRPPTRVWGETGGHVGFTKD
jgi:hypothetical protein